MANERDGNAEAIAEFRANWRETASMRADPPPTIPRHAVDARSRRMHVVALQRDLRRTMDIRGNTTRDRGDVR